MGALHCERVFSAQGCSDESKPLDRAGALRYHCSLTVDGYIFRSMGVVADSYKSEEFFKEWGPEDQLMSLFVLTSVGDHGDAGTMN